MSVGIFDYLIWRGDVPIEQAPFNEVDGAILARLSYLPFEHIVSGRSTEPVRLAYAAEELITLPEFEKRVLQKEDAELVRRLSESARFREMQIIDFAAKTDAETQTQFFAASVRINDGCVCVCFRGTDNTLIGWREDFNMGYLSETPGQLKAAAYVEQMLADGSCPVRIGGHSKGGNLAVYAAVHCSSGLQDRILAVYSNDGPGFRRDIVESAAYQRVLPKIHTILPESSIVGMLLEHQEAYEVVRSSNSGIQQHDAMSWEVLGTSFVYVREVAAQSLMLDETMKAWIYQLNGEEREQIVDTVFGMLEAADIKTVDDFYHSKWKAVQELMKAKSRLPEKSQKVFAKALKLLWSEGNKTVRKTVKQVVGEKRR